MGLFLILLSAFNLFAEDNICTPSFKSAASFAEFITSREMAECQPLKPGSVKDVDIFDSLTRVPQSYRLKRTLDGNYEIIFNLKFGYVTRKNQVRTNELLTRKWRMKAAKCLKEFDNLAQGPEGEKISFKIYEDSDVGAPPLNKIGIRDRGRDNSGTWSEDISCSTILHEVLHLTGLVDEYIENQMALVKDPVSGETKLEDAVRAEKKAFDCRKIYPANSIMADSTRFIIQLKPGYNYEYLFCCNIANGCEEQKAALTGGGFGIPDADKNGDKGGMGTHPLNTSLSSLEGLDKPINIKNLKSCPKGYHFIGSLGATIPISEKERSQFNLETIQPLPTKDGSKFIGISIFKPRPALSNLLEERHFNTIIYPGCFSRNWKYYEESNNANKTSHEHGGKGCWSTSKIYDRLFNIKMTSVDYSH